MHFFTRSFQCLVAVVRGFRPYLLSHKLFAVLSKKLQYDLKAVCISNSTELIYKIDTVTVKNLSNFREVE